MNTKPLSEATIERAANPTLFTESDFQRMLENLVQQANAVKQQQHDAVKNNERVHAQILGKKLLGSRKVGDQRMPTGILVGIRVMREFVASINSSVPPSAT